MPKVSLLGKQVLGAAVGMTIAAALYVGVDQFSLGTIGAYLVNPAQVSENAGTVSTNRKVVDADTLRRIAGRAQEVAKALRSQSTSAPDLVSEQGAVASSQANVLPEQRNADSIYPGGFQQPATIDERIQSRIARTAEAIGEGRLAPPLYVSRQFAMQAGAVNASQHPAAPSEQLNEGTAPVDVQPTSVVQGVASETGIVTAPPTKASLPNSGPLLSASVLLALALAAYVRRTAAMKHAIEASDLRP